MINSKQTKIDSETTAEIVDLQSITSCNMANCFFRLKNYNKAIEKATESINLKKNVKALYRRGMSYGALEQYDQAVEDFLLVVKMDTSDPNDYQ